MSGILSATEVHDGSAGEVVDNPFTKGDWIGTKLLIQKIAGNGHLDWLDALLYYLQSGFAAEALEERYRTLTTQVDCVSQPESWQGPAREFANAVGRDARKIGRQHEH